MWRSVHLHAGEGGGPVDTGEVEGLGPTVVDDDVDDDDPDPGTHELFHHPQPLVVQAAGHARQPQVSPV
ncbi:hypothetical protein V3N99_01385 [Dermatophilaceae bacterium Soc4.6]